jgi:uncharacterized protein (TIGR03067 family)
MNEQSLVVEGAWQMVRAELAGEAAPDEMVQHTALELTAGEYRVRYGGEVVDQGTYEIGGALGVKTMLLRGLVGQNAGRTIPCVWQLMGDRLRVCYGLNGVAPTEFTTATGDERYLAVYRRERHL